ncbi:unnamed protein product [Amoebophrya sp. A25]|nr:unnamed protein product [Amoebophrya sp. A25]|eukprot:GSA25T00012266001.1
MDAALTELFHEWADPTSTPVSVSFTDLCCMLRWYQVFDAHSLDHTDIVELWAELENFADFDEETGESLVIEEYLFPTLIEKVAALVYATRSGAGADGARAASQDAADDGGGGKSMDDALGIAEDNDWMTEQFVNDLALAAPTYRNSDEERRARDQMRRFFAPIFEIDIVDSAYERGVALASIFAHYQKIHTKPSETLGAASRDGAAGGGKGFKNKAGAAGGLSRRGSRGLLEDDDYVDADAPVAFVSAENLERLCVDIGLLPSVVTHDTFLQIVREYGEENYDFSQFVEVFLALILSCEDETLSVEDVFHRLRIPKNVDYDGRRLPFLRKLRENEKLEDEERAALVLIEAANLFETLPPPVNRGIGPHPGSIFSEEELQKMPIQPMPIEEVIAKIHAPKPKGGAKKGKKKKKKKGGDDAGATNFPKVDPGTIVWMNKRPVKPSPNIPARMDFFPRGYNRVEPSRAKIRHDYASNWLLRPVLIEEPVPFPFVAAPSTSIFVSGEDGGGKLAPSEDRPTPSDASSGVAGGGLSQDCLSFCGAGFQYRNRNNLHAAFFSLWKAFRIYRGTLRPGPDKACPYREPQYSEAFDVPSCLRDLIDTAAGPNVTETVGNADADLFFHLTFASIAVSMCLDALALGLAYHTWKRNRNSKPRELVAKRQLALILFRQNEYALASRLFLSVVKSQEAALGDCNLELASSYNNLAAAYMMLHPFPRNQEALAYFTLASKLHTLFAPLETEDERRTLLRRNLDKAQVAARGRRFEAKPFLWYMSLVSAKPKEDKKKKKGGAKKKKK